MCGVSSERGVVVKGSKSDFISYDKLLRDLPFEALDDSLSCGGVVECAR